MNAADVVGYADTENGVVYCTEHGDNSMAPIFADSEWDYVPACDECGEHLPVNLTQDGIIKDLYDDGFRTGTDIATANEGDLQDVWSESANEEDFEDKAMELLSEAEEGSRQFTPFEFFAKKLNDHEYHADELWEAYDEGIGEAFNTAIANMISKFSEDE